MNLSIFETYFGSRDSYFYKHFKEHVATNYSEYFAERDDELFEPMSEDEYDEYAHELSQQPVYSSDYDDPNDVVGFVTTNNRIIKFRKSLSDVVVYKATRKNPHTITYYKVNSRKKRKRYNALLKDYLREILPEDDYYNV